MEVDDGSRPTVATNIPTRLYEAWKIASLDFICFSLQRKEKHETRGRRESHMAGMHVIVCIWVWTETERKKINKTSDQPASLKALTCDHQQLA